MQGKFDLFSPFSWFDLLIRCNTDGANDQPRFSQGLSSSHPSLTCFKGVGGGGIRNPGDEVGQMTRLVTHTVLTRLLFLSNSKLNETFAIIFPVLNKHDSSRNKQVITNYASTCSKFIPKLVVKIYFNGNRNNNNNSQ